MYALLQPQLDVLLFEIVFPLMCFSDSDQKLWVEDPHECERKAMPLLKTCIVLGRTVGMDFISTAVSLACISFEDSFDTKMQDKYGEDTSTYPGDGCTVRFWSDIWIPKLGILSQYSLLPLTDYDLCKKVQEFILGNGAWNILLLKNILPPSILDHIHATIPPSYNGETDSVAWAHSNDGNFSIKTAYDTISNNLFPTDEMVFKLIWNWRGPQRMRTFMRKVENDILPTNQFRGRRHLTTNTMCPCCGLEEETTIHALHDCLEAVNIWLCFVPGQSKDSFMRLELKQWIIQNLKQPVQDMILINGALLL
ncbi:hypothetical protein RIF29_29849 [Crotalaria pallida]|uniref:Reverse transcriptase zinc-binding domain-containing protein n=1 Tax=Crotalaria pallida TaxID=3830 RepID=A0AAN9HWK3_CROPI